MAETMDLKVKEDVHGVYIQKISKRIKYLADENLVKHNITLEQVKILGFLNAQREDSIAYQKDIETKFEIRRSSVTNILKNMEKSGLLTREGDPYDARIKRVRLTKKGKEQALLLRNYIDNLEMVIVNGMSTEEKDQFLHYLKRAFNNIEKLMKDKTLIGYE